MKSKNDIYFHASSVGRLMIGGHELWSDRDEEKLAELELRKTGEFLTESGRKGQYTKGMQDDHAALIVKKANYEDVIKNGGQNFQLGATAKTYIKDIWLNVMFGFKEPMMSKEVMKGMMTEGKCIDLVSEVDPIEAFRMQTTGDDRMNDGMFNGLTDIKYSIEVDFLEDIKSAWSLRQFMSIQTLDDIDPNYYAQGQVYMKLYKKSRFKIRYCIVDTPDELIEAERKRFYYRLGADADQEDYIKIAEQIEKNHKVEHLIDAQYRVKTFEFEYDEDYMNELEKRVKVARKYFESLRLNTID